MSNYQLYNQDYLEGLEKIEDSSIDLILTDPPYCLGKDYGNESDKLQPNIFLEWMEKWIDKSMPKLKPNGSMYIFTTWKYSPEIFSMIKKKMTMVNEIIWDRKVPSMGGTTRKYSSVHDNIGFFVKSKDYYFDLDSIRIPYDSETKKKRTRSIFKGKKWLELGYNPKDLWSVSRLHKIHRERVSHPTQKPLEIITRMVKASCPVNGIVLDPFVGSGTTIEACLNTDRNCIAFEINSDYCEIIRERVKDFSILENLSNTITNDKYQSNSHKNDDYQLTTLF
ncbi:MAG: site-specific DNA-methyltransferase [Rhodobacteraceae bacterium]|nr:site-specific DNA-methyltransferase [Paracoccaceae bacterium]